MIFRAWLHLHKNVLIASVVENTRLQATISIGPTDFDSRSTRGVAGKLVSASRVGLESVTSAKLDLVNQQDALPRAFSP